MREHSREALVLPVGHCGTSQARGSATGTQLKTSIRTERCTSIEVHRFDVSKAEG